MTNILKVDPLQMDKILLCHLRQAVLIVKEIIFFSDDRLDELKEPFTKDLKLSGNWSSLRGNVKFFKGLQF